MNLCTDFFFSFLIGQTDTRSKIECIFVNTIHNTIHNFFLNENVGAGLPFNHNVLFRTTSVLHSIARSRTFALSSNQAVEW